MSKLTLASYHSSVTKGLFDLLFSVLGLVIFLPVIIIISIVILITSKGSAFFIQKRTGYKGKPFKIIMFRTMYVGAEKDQNKYRHLNQSDGPVFKINKFVFRRLKINKFVHCFASRPTGGFT